MSGLRQVLSRPLWAGGMDERVFPMWRSHWGRWATGNPAWLCSVGRLGVETTVLMGAVHTHWKAGSSQARRKGSGHEVS